MKHPGHLRNIENTYGQRKVKKDYESAVARVGLESECRCRTAFSISA